MNTANACIDGGSPYQLIVEAPLAVRKSSRRGDQAGGRESGDGGRVASVPLFFKY